MTVSDSPLFFLHRTPPTSQTSLSSSRSNRSGSTTPISSRSRANSDLESNKEEWTVVKSNREKSSEKPTTNHLHPQRRGNYRGRGGGRKDNFYRSKSDQTPRGEQQQQQQNRHKRNIHSEGDLPRGGGRQQRGSFRGRGRGGGGTGRGGSGRGSCGAGGSSGTSNTNSHNSHHSSHGNHSYGNTNQR